jgi:hypothetical protein
MRMLKALASCGDDDDDDDDGRLQRTMARFEVVRRGYFGLTPTPPLPPPPTAPPLPRHTRQVGDFR